MTILVAELINIETTLQVEAFPINCSLVLDRLYGQMVKR